MQPQVRLLGDRYELQYVLASGGMGRVWRARDTLLLRSVAVKILRSEFTGNPDFLGRFRAEAQHTAVLAHQNIAALYDYGELHQDGEHLAYLVMELVEGESLATLLHREQRLDVPQTLGIIRATAAGLAAAHAAGVVHRDVKPGNVLLGAGRRRQDHRLRDRLVGVQRAPHRTGQVIGTAQYLSPEQATGAARPDPPATSTPSAPSPTNAWPAGGLRGENSVQIAVKQIREDPEPLPAELPAKSAGWSNGRCARTRPNASRRRGAPGGRRRRAGRAATGTGGPDRSDARPGRGGDRRPRRAGVRDARGGPRAGRGVGGPRGSRGRRPRGADERSDPGGRRDHRRGNGPDDGRDGRTGRRRVRRAAGQGGAGRARGPWPAGEPRAVRDLRSPPRRGARGRAGRKRGARHDHHRLLRRPAGTGTGTGACSGAGRRSSRPSPRAPTARTASAAAQTAAMGTAAGTGTGTATATGTATGTAGGTRTECSGPGSRNPIPTG